MAENSYTLSYGFERTKETYSLKIDHIGHNFLKKNMWRLGVGGGDKYKYDK